METKTRETQHQWAIGDESEDEDDKDERHVYNSKKLRQELQINEP